MQKLFGDLVLKEDAELYPFVQVYKAKISIYQPDYYVKMYNNEILFKPLSRQEKS